MEMLFEAQGVQSEAAYKRFQWATMVENKSLTMFRTLSVVAFLLAIVSLLVREKLSLILCLVLGVYLLIAPKKSIRGAIVELNKKKSIVYKQPYTLRFFENELMHFTPYGETCVQYEMLNRVVETAEDIYLFIAPMQAYILTKSDLTKGSPSALVSFLRDTKRVPYRFVY